MVDPDIFNEVTLPRFSETCVGSVIPPQWPSEIRLNVYRRHDPTIVTPSGAGHNPNALRLTLPYARLIIANIDGRNHAPEEDPAPEDLARSVQALAGMIVSVDKRC